MLSIESAFNNDLYFSTNALARKVEALAKYHFKKVKLAPSHCYLILLLSDVETANAKYVADQLQLNASTVTRLLDKVELKGFIKRKTVGREITLSLTAKAKKLHPIVLGCYNDFTKSYQEIIGKRESNQLTKGLHAINEILVQN
jgi:DNA-binding MarR family transcriptional regulator